MESSVAIVSKRGQSYFSNSRQSFVNRWKVYFRTRVVISRYVREILDAEYSGCLESSAVPQPLRSAKVPPAFFPVWMMMYGCWLWARRGTVKGSIVASSPGERTHSAPQGRPSWNITAEQQTVFCRLYTVNFMPDFLPTLSNSTPPPHLAALAFLAAIPRCCYTRVRDPKCQQ